MKPGILLPICAAIASAAFGATVFVSPSKAAMAAEIAHVPTEHVRVMQHVAPKPETNWRSRTHRIPAGATVVALTFDDGPTAHTGPMLDALAARGVSATFFTTGRNVNNFPEIAARIVDEGHEIACHGHNHPLMTQMSEVEVRLQLINSRNAVSEATGGAAMTLFRPPYGAHNNTVRMAAEDNGMALVLWSIDTFDWRDRDVETIVSRVIGANGRPRVEDGDIILMHDTMPTSVAAAGRIIDALQQNGVYVVTVTQLFEITGQPLVPGRVHNNAR